MKTSKIATPDHPIHQLIEGRWSPRSFADKPVPQAALCSIFEAARWSASAFNAQPWHFILATQEDPDEFQKIVGCLMEGNVPWASKAPVLAISVAQIYNPERERPMAYGWHDTGLAVQNLIVQATSMDLYVHQMAGFDKGKAQETFNIPEDYQPVSALAIGYLGSSEDLPEKYQAGETTPRERKPLSEFVFGGTWGEISPTVK